MRGINHYVICSRSMRNSLLSSVDNAFQLRFHHHHRRLRSCHSSHDVVVVPRTTTTTSTTTTRASRFLRTNDLFTWRRLCVFKVILLLFIHIPPISLDPAATRTIESMSASVMNTASHYSPPPAPSTSLSSVSASDNATNGTSSTAGNATASPTAALSSSSSPPSSSSLPSIAPSFSTPYSSTSTSPITSTTSSSSSTSSPPSRQYHSHHSIPVADPHRCFSMKFRDNYNRQQQPHKSNQQLPLSSYRCAESITGEAEEVMEGSPSCCLDEAIVDSLPLNPLLPCDFLPSEFIKCNEPVDHKSAWNFRSFRIIHSLSSVYF